MSLYALQKAIHDVSRYPAKREAYFAATERFVAAYALTDAERSIFLDCDVSRLYALGIHGLLLRPFTRLHDMSEADYLAAIRREI